MFDLQDDGKLTLPRGDSLLLKITLTGETFPEGTVAIFGVCTSASKSEEVLYKPFPVKDNVIVVWLSNQDTRELAAGTYRWDVRLVTDPEYNEDGSVRCDDDFDNVISIFSGSIGMPAFVVTEVAASV